MADKILKLLNIWVKYGVYNTTPNWTIYTTGPGNDYGLSLQTNCNYYCHSKFQSCTILTPRTAIRRDLQNTFIIKSLRISEYLKLQYSYFSPKYASKVLTYTTNYPVITQLFPDYPVKPTYSQFTNSYIVNYLLFRELLLCSENNANYYLYFYQSLTLSKYNTCTL